MDLLAGKSKNPGETLFQLHALNLFEDIGTTRRDLNVAWDSIMASGCPLLPPVFAGKVRRFGFMPNKFELMLRSEKRAEGVGCRRDFLRHQRIRKHSDWWKSSSSGLRKLLSKAARNAREIGVMRWDLLNMTRSEQEALPITHVS